MGIRMYEKVMSLHTIIKKNPSYNAVECHQGDEGKEIFEIIQSYTGVQERAVVIEFQYTFIADPTMFRSQGPRVQLREEGEVEVSE